MPEQLAIFFTFFVLAAVFFAFTREKIGPHVIAMTAMGVFLISGIISTEDMLKVFSNSAPITIACMFVISAALERTGVIDAMGRGILSLSGDRPVVGVVGFFAILFVLACFMNNTPVVMIFTPMAIVMAEKFKHYPSKYLIPLSYITIMSGTCTLIGTSTNILVDGVAQSYGQPAFTMFEITMPGLFLAGAGILYLATIGRFLLPERPPPAQAIEEGEARKRFVAEAMIPVGSPLIGKTLNEVRFTQSEEYEIIDLVRKERGNRLGFTGAVAALMSSLRQEREEGKGPQEVYAGERGISSLRDIPLEAGDRLLFKVERDELIELKKHIGMEFESDRADISQSLPTHSVMTVEGVVSRQSNLIGKRIRDLGLRRRYNCYVIGLHRMGRHVGGDLGSIILREGDTLILEGPEEELDKLFDNENILSPSQIRSRPLDKKRAPIAILTILGVVFLSTIGVMPIAGLAFIGALVVILLGCVTPDQAYKTIDWRILLLIFGMLGMGTAMENSGAMQMLVNATVDLARPLGPLALLALIYLLTSILTELVTNNAVAIVMTPIAIGVATALGLDPRPFIVAVMFAASSSFATPIGYQTNTFVYAAGGYKFIDFVKLGMPLNVIMMIVTVLVIPMFWPLEG